VISIAVSATTSITFPNTTLAILSSPTPSPSLGPQPYTFSIEISNQRQHVGQWYGRYISDDLTKLLKNRCDNDKTGANTCKTKKDKYDNIEYSNERGYVKREDEFVEVNVESDYIPRKNEGGVSYDGKSLQNAFIAQIADTFRKSGEDEKNCYKFDQKSTLCIGCIACIPFDGRARVLRWCNAPEYVRVSVKNEEGKEIAHMKVVLKFTGKTDKGMFDCMAIREGVEKSARDHRLKEVKDAVNGREVEANVTCSGEEVTGNCPNNCLYQLGKCFK
jgi:hypothetical protein